ncbi:MAG: MarR family transcriptional regulator [Alphaproteobacteria bacterium]|nr:MarR family transcriptional regulator [Alphaproteobacteria bacterium]
MATIEVDKDPLTTARERLAELYGRPGFMIRRAHQITISVFQAHAGELGLTNTQFGVLYILKRYPRIDQVTLAKLLRLDRLTTGTVVATLESRGLVARDVGAADRRRRVLALTQEGETMLHAVQQRSAGTSATLLAALTPEERRTFLDLLARLVTHFETGDGTTEINPTFVDSEG